METVKTVIYTYNQHMNTTNTSLHNTHLYFRNLFFKWMYSCIAGISSSVHEQPLSDLKGLRIWGFSGSLAYAKCIKQFH